MPSGVAQFEEERAPWISEKSDQAPVQVDSPTDKDYRVDIAQAAWDKAHDAAQEAIARAAAAAAVARQQAAVAQEQKAAAEELATAAEQQAAVAREADLRAREAAKLSEEAAGAALQAIQWADELGMHACTPPLSAEEALAERAAVLDEREEDLKAQAAALVKSKAEVKAWEEAVKVREEAILLREAKVREAERGALPIGVRGDSPRDAELDATNEKVCMTDPMLYRRALL